jgi:hypothetical protein
MPVLAGSVPGTTVAVSRTASPAKVEAGVANPVTDGGMLVFEGGQTVTEVAVLRGFGVPALKSTLLLFVFTQALVRIAAVVFDNVAVGDPSEQFAAEPNPTKSCRLLSLVGHEPESAEVLLTSATLPAVALMAIVPAASGEGSEVEPAEPWDS